MRTRSMMAVCLAMTPMLALFAADSSAQPRAGGREFAGGSLIVRIDGVGSSPIESAQGGGSVLTVGTVPSTDGKPVKRTLGAPEVKPLTVDWSLGTVMADEALLAWVARTVAGTPPQQFDGALGILNHDSTTTMELQLKSTAVMGFEVSPLSASSKGDSTSISFIMHPASTSWNTKPDGAKVNLPIKTSKRGQVSNFRVTIPGLPCTRIMSVGGIGAERTPEGWLADNVVLQVSMADMADFITWQQDTIKNPQGAPVRKTMTIELLDAAMKNAVATFQANGVGIVRADPQIPTPGRDAVASGEVELVVEGWTLK